MTYKPITAREFRVLVNYKLDGVTVWQSLYTGPHRKHADNAFLKAGVLGDHGILSNCTVTFFDGFRVREDWTKTFGPRANAAKTNGTS